MAFWDRYLTGSEVFRQALNIWPPYVGAGITLDYVAKDFRQLRVSLKDRVINRNYVGSHFGGSLFAMTDPFYMLMLIRILGPKYYVWDKGATIDFKKPAYGTVRVSFVVTDEMLAEILEKTRNGKKFEPVYVLEITDGDGDVVARVEKTMYVRLKPKFRPRLSSHPTDDD